MSPDNRKRLVDIVGRAGDDLRGMLPPTVEIPNRNAYAHIWREIKQKWGVSYKDIDDSLFNDVAFFISKVRLEVMTEHYQRMNGNQS